MARPIGPSDIFAESAWLPSLKRYMDGDDRDRLTVQDRLRILFVHDALCSRDLPLVVLNIISCSRMVRADQGLPIDHVRAGIYLETFEANKSPQGSISAHLAVFLSEFPRPLSEIKKNMGSTRLSAIIRDAAALLLKFAGVSVENQED